MKEITINNRVVEVLHQKFHLPHDILIQKHWDKPLTLEPFYFSDIEMVYLLFELEKSYGMCVKSEDMDDYGYSTIRKITNIMEGI